MDAWLKSAVKEAAKFGNELQQRLEGPATSDGRRDLTFGRGDLGFELEGIRVSAVTRDGQAEKLGVQVGDRLVAVAGYEVPLPKKADEEAERRANVQVRKWLRELPRPGTLTFAPAEVTDPTPAAGTGPPTLTGSEPAPPAGMAHAASTGSAAQGLASPREAGTCGGAQPTKEAQERAVQCARLKEELRSEKERTSTLRAELFVAQEQGRSAEAELLELRRECQALRHMAVEHDDVVGNAQSRLEVQCRGLQDQLQRAREESEAAKRKVAELQSKVAAAEDLCKELQASCAQGEEAVRELFEGRERVLEEETSRLRAALATADAERRAAVSAAAEHQRASDELRILVAKRAAELQDAEARAAAAEAAATAAMRELRASHEGAAAALEQAQLEHQRALGEMQRRLDEAHAAASRLAAAADAGVAAAAALGEGGGGEEAVPLADAASDDGEDVAVPALSSGGRWLSESDRDPAAPSAEAVGVENAELRELVRQLETRCCALQRKLNSRPIVFQAVKRNADAELGGAGPQNGGIASSWEPGLRTLLGGGPAALLLRALGAPDRIFRKLTERLLRSDALLRAFYAHLVLLYAIAASWYAQTTASPASPIDALSSGGVVLEHTVATAAGGR